MPVGGDRGLMGALYDSHEIVFITEDMRVVAKSRYCIIDTQGGWIGVNVRLPDLKYIENILHVQLDVRPIDRGITLFGPYNKKIDGNVVGMSLYNTVAGTSICVDVIAVGPPQAGGRLPIVATLHRDGRTIVKSTITRVVPAGAQGLYITVTFPELRTVEQIMHIEVTTNPIVWILTAGLMQNKMYLNNTVGISLYLDPAAGTTLVAEVLAIGF